MQRDRRPIVPGAARQGRNVRPCFRDAKLGRFQRQHRALQRYRNSRAGGLAPQRNDIEPADIKPLPPFLPAADVNGANRILLDAYTRAFETAAPDFGTYSWPTRVRFRLNVPSVCSPCASASKFSNASPSRIIRASRLRWPTTASPSRG